MFEMSARVGTVLADFENVVSRRTPLVADFLQSMSSYNPNDYPDEEQLAIEHIHKVLKGERTRT